MILLEDLDLLAKARTEGQISSNHNDGVASNLRSGLLVGERGERDRLDGHDEGQLNERGERCKGKKEKRGEVHRLVALGRGVMCLSHCSTTCHDLVQVFCMCYFISFFF